MSFDFSKMPKEIVSERSETFDLLGHPTRRWRVLYMTPPWLFPHRSEKGDGKKPTSQKSDSLDIGDLSTIPMGDILEKDAVVFIWTPDTQLPKVLALLDIWGLRYNGTAFYWTRTREDTDRTAMHHEKDIPMYTGYITRGNPIPLIMGVQGEPGLRKHHHADGTYRPRKDIRKQQFAPFTSGEANPRFRELVETLYDGPYLELFGRGKEGWDTWSPSASK